MLGKIVGLIAITLSVIGVISLCLSYAPAFNYTMKGDVANATEATANATVDNLTDEVYWTLIGTIVIAVASIFGLGTVARKIFG
jgi:ABC-type Na+ efflux pump permease subunit